MPSVLAVSSAVATACNSRFQALKTKKCWSRGSTVGAIQGQLHPVR